MKDYLEYIEESTNTVKIKTRLSKLLVVLCYLVIWAFNIMASWRFSAGSITEAQAGCLLYTSDAADERSMDYAPGRHDRSVSFDREKQLLGKVQVAGADWIWPYVHAFRLCELWHERKIDL